MDVSPDIINALASNGPWAVLSGYLLITILNAWRRDRESRDQLLTEFRMTLEKLADKIDRAFK